MRLLTVGLLLGGAAALHAPALAHRSVRPAHHATAPSVLARAPSIVAKLQLAKGSDVGRASPAAVLRALRRRAAPTTVGCSEDTDGCLALCDSDGECDVIAPLGLANRVRVAFYFGVWFALSVGYSITNKRLTNAFPMPWSVATATVVVGGVFVSALWALGLRTPPKLSSEAIWRTFLPIGTFHAIGHIAGTVGTAAGSVSFAQVVKAAGPVYACALSALVLKQAVSVRVWLSLAPIVAGVALATVKELSFAWAALLGAVISDLALALRNVLSKQSMSKPEAERGENLTPANLFGVLTIISAVVSIPMALVAEGPKLPAAWAAAAAAAPGGSAGLAGQIALTGLYFYGYSEVAMKALNNVHPVTHAIGNTMRRVVIMLVCMLAFRTPMTPLGALGSAFAIAGSYLYAITKHHEKVLEKQRLEQEEDDVATAVAVEQALPLKVTDEAEKALEAKDE